MRRGAREEAEHVREKTSDGSLCQRDEGHSLSWVKPRRKSKGQGTRSGARLAGASGARSLAACGLVFYPLLLEGRGCSLGEGGPTEISKSEN